MRSLGTALRPTARTGPRGILARAGEPRKRHGDAVALPHNRLATIVRGFLTTGPLVHRLALGFTYHLPTIWQEDQPVSRYLSGWLARWAIAAVVVASLAGNACADTLVVSGRPRTYTLVTPSAAGRVPLVVVLHGLGGNGQSVAASTGWDKLARDEGFAAVFPDAENGSWEIGAAEAILPSNPDVAFLNKLVATLVANGTADPRRVYITGVSRGGAMTYAMMCAKSQLFAAAAPVIASALASFEAVCHVARPAPMLFINGTADPLVPYRGGYGTGPTANVNLMPVPDFVAAWRRINGCEQRTETTALPDLDKTDKSTVTRISGPCPSGREIVAYRVDGGGHHQPRRPAPRVPDPRSANLGPQNHDIDGAATIWAFVKGHAL